MRRRIELTGTNSPSGLFFMNFLSPVNYKFILEFVLAFKEEGVHPTPFRTRQLSPPSSMILRRFAWESRTTPRHF